MTQARNHTQEEKSAAQDFLQALTSESCHLWHGRVGMLNNGKWVPRGKNRTAQAIPPGLYEPDAIRLWDCVQNLYRVDPMFVGQLASYAMRQLDWRDLKVVLAAYLLVQPQDWLREVGEAMILPLGGDIPQKRRMRPKDVYRVGEILRSPGIVSRVRTQFGYTSNCPMGAYRRTLQKWLLIRERIPGAIQGLVGSGYTGVVRSLAQQARYNPERGDFFRLLRWKQKPNAHRIFGIGESIQPVETWDGLDENAIVKQIKKSDRTYMTLVGKIPPAIGLTKSILQALIKRMSAQDVLIALPAIEEAGLLGDPTVTKIVEKAVKSAQDHRAATVKKNLKTEAAKDLADKAVAAANTKAVKEAVPDRDVRVIFLLDISGSQQGGIEMSKQILPNLLTGLDPQRVHAVAFNTNARMLYDGKGTKADLAIRQIDQVLKGLHATGGTLHHAGIRALSALGVKKQPNEILILIVVGDEDGEEGSSLVSAMREAGLVPDAIGFVYNPVGGRGRTLKTCATLLQVPLVDVGIENLKDPYQIPKFLRGLVDAPVMQVTHSTAPQRARFSLLEKISLEALLVPPIVPPRQKLPVEA